LDAETCRGFNEHNKLLTTPLSISWFLSPTLLFKLAMNIASLQKKKDFVFQLLIIVNKNIENAQTREMGAHYF
jgi:hypothetical protein